MTRSSADRIGTLRRYLRRQDGAVTVENVLWVPFFIIFTCIIIDFGMMFNAQARVLEAAEDGLRGLSVGQFADTTATNAFIEQALSVISPNAVATTDDGKIDNILKARVIVPSKDINGFGVLTAFRTNAFVIETSMFKEYQQ